MMRTREELAERLKGYDALDVIYDDDVGYIVWHLATGDNVEMLFIEAAEKGKGHGTELYRMMVRKIVEDRAEPYHSLYGFRRSDNREAAWFYESLGFRQVDLGESIYRRGGVTLMWVPWLELRATLGV